MSKISDTLKCYSYLLSELLSKITTLLTTSVEISRSFFMKVTLGNQVAKFGPVTQTLVLKAFLGPKISTISTNFSAFMKWHC